jgi:Xaa-Pro aminopeptidase
MAATTTHSIVSQRLGLLRRELKRQRLDAFIVQRQDEFQGEYVAAYAERLKWATGFSGSWGTGIIGMQEAAIFVDGRYTVQVKQEVDGRAFQFHHLLASPPVEWIAKTFRKGSRIGYDPRLLSIADARRYATACETAKLRLVAVSRNPIDAVWDKQPARPASPIVDHPRKFAGATVAKKLAGLRAVLKEKGADAVILADPTSVAWAFNVRASDVPFTPVALAYALIPATGKAQLFADARRLAGSLREQLSCPGPDIDAALKSLGRRKAKVLLDPVAAPDHFRLTLGHAGAVVIEGPDPCLLPKAMKNKTEQRGARAAHAMDAVAMAHFLAWLDNHNAPESLTEEAVAKRLEEYRREQKSFKDLSFGSISAAAANAALPHYHAKGDGAHLQRNSIYLIDSGGQYREGTTDITRTVVIGDASQELRERFTLVLKGMIAVSLLRFPEGTTGAHIDALARAALWKAGCDFDHGTGHGVGSFLSVHEGPARISKTGHQVLRPGMILSNEPGYYKVGHFGIRIENLLLVTPPAKIAGGDRAMLGFETLTFTPIDRRLINARLLTREEVQWLDSYHAQVHALLASKVADEAKAWLNAACAPLS